MRGPGPVIVRIRRRAYICGRRIATFSPPYRHLHLQRKVASLRLFGGLSIETAAGPMTGRATQRRRLALLALLATSRGATREKLIFLLWPDVDSERGRRLLSDSIYRINQALGEETIIAAADELRLAPERLPSDVGRFEQCLADGRPAEAVAVYAGPFLDGFFLDAAPEFEQWASGERERLARLCAGALETLASESEAAGDVAQATHWWYRVAAHDPLSPRVALRLMQALEAAGERAAALRHARVFAALFHQELGVEPDPVVADFAWRLERAPRSGSAPSHDSAAPVERAPMSGSAPSHESAVPVERAPTSGSAPSHDSAAPVGRAPMSGSAPSHESAGASSQMATSAAPSSHTSPDPAAEPGDHGRMGRSAVVTGTAVALLLTLLAAVGWLVYHGGSSVAGVPTPALAVLPFADHSPGRDHAYFASGIVEEVASALSRAQGVRVVSSAGSPVTNDIDIQEVGRRLGVDHVLAGSISRWGDSVRVNARLLRVSDRVYLWSESWTTRLGSIFAIQDSISRAIGATLVARLVGSPSDVPADPSSAELEAYNLYLKARYAWHRRTQASLASAVTYFEQAVAVAPRYARAHAGLADAYAVQGFYDYVPPQDAFTRAEAAARRALDLDPSLAQPWATLGYVSLYYHWNWADAERAFARALELDPGYSTAHQWQANYFTAMGRFTEAEQAMRRAMELDPLSLIANGALGWVFYNAGQHERAIEQFNRTLELDPDFKLAWFWSGMAHEQLGRLDHAIRLLEHALSLSPESALTEAALAHAYATAGRSADARAKLRELLAVEERYIPAFEVAKAHLALGEVDTALEWLDRARLQRSHSIAFLRVDPQLAPLQNDPRFRRLLQTTGH
jgi:DNA-binding SARP family transcriptional activator/TolB-like protein/Tfp pilus assembly protein PilF